MSDRNKEVVPGTRAPVLGDALLTRIHQLNRDYVELLIASATSHLGNSAEMLPPKVLDALARLSANGLSALARNPFALYSLGFDDQRFWTAVLADAQADDRPVQQRYGAAHTMSEQSAFSEVVLFFAWHVASAHRVATRFLFAMPDAIAVQLAGAPLWRLKQIVLDYPDMLTPRWPTNPAFWPDMVRFAAAADAGRLEATRLLGNQLIASELDGSLPCVRRRLIRTSQSMKQGL